MWSQLYSRLFFFATGRVHVCDVADDLSAELHGGERGELHRRLGHRLANLHLQFLGRELGEFLFIGVLGQRHRRLVDGKLLQGLRPLRQHEALVPLEVPYVVRWNEPGLLQIRTVWRPTVRAHKLPPTSSTGGDPVRVEAKEAALRTARVLATDEEAVGIRQDLVEVLHLHPHDLRVRAWDASRVTLLCLDAFPLLVAPGDLLQLPKELGMVLFFMESCASCAAALRSRRLGVYIYSWRHSGFLQ